MFSVNRFSDGLWKESESKPWNFLETRCFYLCFGSYKLISVTLPKLIRKKKHNLSCHWETAKSSWLLQSTGYTTDSSENKYHNSAFVIQGTLGSRRRSRRKIRTSVKLQYTDIFLPEMAVIFQSTHILDLYLWVHKCDGGLPYHCCSLCIMSSLALYASYTASYTECV